ncbi:MAG: hypothetical protein P8010_00805 [Desulfosarcinaceae bacterium]
MAKIKKRKLSWKASPSAQTTGYKLYWARQGELGYDSACEYLGPVTQVVIPDGLSAFTPRTGPFEFGIVAVDDSGNESDMATITVPFHFIAPQAPGEIEIEGEGADGTAPPDREKILAPPAENKTPGQRQPTVHKPAAQTDDKASASADDAPVFFETERADAGVMFTKEDLEIFESDLKL